MTCCDSLTVTTQFMIPRLYKVSTNLYAYILTMASVCESLAKHVGKTYVSQTLILQNISKGIIWLQISVVKHLLVIFMNFRKALSQIFILGAYSTGLDT